MTDTRGDVSWVVLRRFLPATTFSFTVVLGVALLLSPQGLGFIQLTVLAREIIAMTAGFGLATTLGRKLLPKGRKRLGRRAVVLGSLAPILLGAASFFLQGIGLAGITVASAATGAFMGLGMLAPRLPRPRGLRFKRREMLESPNDRYEAWLREFDREGELEAEDRSPRSAA